MIWQNKVFRNKLFNNYIIIATMPLHYITAITLNKNMDVSDAFPFGKAGYPAAGNLAQYY